VGIGSPNLSNLARSLGVSEQIHLAGEVEHDKVHGYYTVSLLRPGDAGGRDAVDVTGSHDVR
jgi:hypothetical protein